MITRTLFGPEHEAFRDSFAKFLEQEAVPFHDQWEEQGYVDRKLWSKAGENGFLCTSMPEEYGGVGADQLFSVIEMEELARANVSGIGFSLHSEIVAPYILHYGTPEQKAKYLPKMASGELIGAIAMTEPAAGSDLQGIKTRAERKGDHFVLHGSKTFITNGWHADVVIVVAKTNPNEGAKGTSLFLIERGMAGFEKGKRLKKLGLKAQDTSELFFNDVIVPMDNLLGGPSFENRGFVCLMEELPWERLQIAVTAVASAQAAVEWTTNYVKERKAFGQPVGNFQNTRYKLAEKPDRSADRPSLSGSVHRVVDQEAARYRNSVDGQVLVHGLAVQSDGRMRATPRGLRLHVGIPGYPGVCRCTRPAHLRGHQ